MAVARKSAVKSTEKLTIAKRLGCIMISVVTIRKNSNGKSYIPTPFGAVYARINEVKPGLHSVVELSNGAYALNTPTIEDQMEFLNGKLNDYPNLSMEDIKGMYGL
jgi:hypothetical protein